MKTIIDELYFLNRPAKRLIIFLSDIFLIIISSYITHAIQLQYFPPLGRSLVLYCIISSIIYFFLFFFFKKFNFINRHFDVNSINSIFISIFLLFVFLYLISLIYNLRFLVLNFIFFQNLIFLFLIILLRIFIRNIYTIKENFNKNKIVCAIYGSGESAYQLSNNSNFTSKYYVSFFIDEDKNKIGQYLGDKKIISLNELKKYSVKKCFFCDPSLSSFKKKEIYLFLKKYKIDTDFNYNQNLLKSSNSENNMDIGIKETSLTEKKSLKNKLYKNKVIFITGGAGSIGSEICFQIYNLKPKKIVIIDNNEFNLSKLKLSLMSLKNPNIVKCKLVDVCSYSNLKDLFIKYKPNFVFHASAYKHVDIVEENSEFSIKNNIIGIDNVLKLSQLVKTRNFIFVSTDKAVRPKNIMGLTKKIGEILTTFYANKEKGKYNYNSVRFGNVIGSSGSFLQIFKKQFNNGGPITLTSKKATRYFMTINDAVNLVIQSPFLEEAGSTFILKMGKAINIYQMVKDLIKKNNFDLKNGNTGDIKIKVIGLRRGEKLHEELFENKQHVFKTKNPLIMVEKNKTKMNTINLNKFIKNIKNNKFKNEDLKLFLKN